VSFHPFSPFLCLLFSRAQEMRCRGSPFEPYPAAVDHYTSKYIHFYSWQQLSSSINQSIIIKKELITLNRALSRHGMDFSFSLLSVAKSHQPLRSWSPFNTKMATTQPTKSYSSSYPSSLHLHSCEEDSAINTGRLPVTCTFLVKSNQMPARLFLSLLLASFNGRFLSLLLARSWWPDIGWWKDTTQFIRVIFVEWLHGSIGFTFVHWCYKWFVDCVFFVFVI
jgi:hypothetical protein